jgi:hypothetical protein
MSEVPSVLIMLSARNDMLTQVDNKFADMGIVFYVHFGVRQGNS